MWSLTFMVNGKKRVERIPDDWVTELRPLVEGARVFKDAASEVFAANAQLLALCRRQEAESARTKKHRGKKR